MQSRIFMTLYSTYLTCAASFMLAAVLTLSGTPSHARVTKIVIDEVSPLSSSTDSSGTNGGPTPGIRYEQIAGRAYGELDPKL